uniref:Uncharacterized protein n=1 Tax=Leucosporidium scottii TaxID=5278 RepID=A0A0H5FS36_9BASI|nr:hypothetical protein [Leucosporidium scottii]
MGAGAQEFIPRRAETPALSEDAPFFTPASQRPPQPPGLNGIAFQNKLLEAAAQQQAGVGSGAPSPVGSDAQHQQQQPQGLAEYYGQMDLACTTLLKECTTTRTATADTGMDMVKIPTLALKAGWVISFDNLDPPDPSSSPPPYTSRSPPNPKRLTLLLRSI